MQEKQEKFIKHISKLASVRVKEEKIPIYSFSPPGDNSLLMRVAVPKTTFKLEKKRHTSWSRYGMLSRHRAPWKLGFLVQYKGTHLE